MTSGVSPMNWCWKVKNNTLVPIDTTLDPAPSNYLILFDAIVNYPQKPRVQQTFAHVARTRYLVWLHAEIAVVMDAITWRMKSSRTKKVPPSKRNRLIGMVLICSSVRAQFVLLGILLLFCVYSYGFFFDYTFNVF